MIVTGYFTLSFQVNWSNNVFFILLIQGVLLAEGFTNFVSDRVVCISQSLPFEMVAKTSIESLDLMNLLACKAPAHLCEADVIGNLSLPLCEGHPTIEQLV